jgi:hypothetical protein
LHVCLAQGPNTHFTTILKISLKMPCTVLETPNNTGNYVPVKKGNISILSLIAYLTIFSYFTLTPWFSHFHVFKYFQPNVGNTKSQSFNIYFPKQDTVPMFSQNWEILTWFSQFLGWYIFFITFIQSLIDYFPKVENIPINFPVWELQKFSRDHVGNTEIKPVSEACNLYICMCVCINFISTQKSHHYINNALPESCAYIQLYKSM